MTKKGGGKEKKKKKKLLLLFLIRKVRNNILIKNFLVTSFCSLGKIDGKDEINHVYQP